MPKPKKYRQDDELPALTALELRRVVSVDEAARLLNLSSKTVRRRYADKLVRVSERRVGLRVADVLALQISAGTAA